MLIVNYLMLGPKQQCIMSSLMLLSFSLLLLPAKASNEVITQSQSKCWAKTQMSKGFFIALQQTFFLQRLSLFQYLLVAYSYYFCFSYLLTGLTRLQTLDIVHVSLCLAMLITAFIIRLEKTLSIINAEAKGIAIAIKCLSHVGGGIGSCHRQGWWQRRKKQAKG